ncbi:CHAP domain-containing protein [Pseudochryseolinea flava]|uniref:CHAP domain-containing protein n=1 Tax=Pseudochryseolinea flava TaxID=2059302 RepID=A0A364XW52_9BACT|nr:CHAP domain-containing protein [Pseudochryseolinea flava]RAV98414.1 CHAP domain-containing protein [Pseudochryseolinea flava]
MKKIVIIAILTLAIVGLYFVPWRKAQVLATLRVGDPVDSLHGVVVYYNGDVSNVGERNLSSDGYNLGIKYQCVEFVKRYYYQHLQHKMPDSYGNAKDFFDQSLDDGTSNVRRDLTQYRNRSKSKPQENDLLVYSATSGNPYGHVSIIASIDDDEIEIIQQNPGAFGKSRARFKLIHEDGKWWIDNDRILGWLRK